MKDIRKCVICNKDITTPVNIGYCFCSSRCQYIDLYNWLFDVYDYQEEVSNPPLVIEEEEKPEKFWRN